MVLGVQGMWVESWGSKDEHFGVTLHKDVEEEILVYLLEPPGALLQWEGEDQSWRNWMRNGLRVVVELEAKEGSVPG